MALADIRVGHKTAAFFAANPTLVLKDGQLCVVSDGANIGKYKIGDGTTQLSALTFYGGVSTTPAWGVITGIITDQTDLVSYVASGAIAFTNKTGNISQWTNNSGYITLTGLSAGSPLAYNNLTGAFTIQVANTSQNGYLSSTDWNTFNNKGSGTVTGVSGTTNRITSTGGATPVIDISSSYIGQSSITTLGTIGTGVWQGTAIADSYISSAATWNAKESALTFSTGLTRATNTITNNLSVGVSGGQIAIGGTGVGDALGLKGTTGNGTSTVAAINFLVGNNGATTAAVILNSGYIGIANSAPADYLCIGNNDGTTDKHIHLSYNNVIGSSTGNGTLGAGGGNAFGFYMPSNSAGSSFLVNKFASGTLNINAYKYDFTSQGNLTSGAITAFNFQPATNTGQTASTNIPNYKVNGTTKTFAAGAHSVLYFNWFTANTNAYASASTATLVCNTYIDAPLQGTNATNTNMAALGLGGHLYMLNSVGVPSNNPTGGGIIYVESGALKYRGSSGTVTTIANA